MKIETFRGEYRWLSNFWPPTVLYDGIDYPTVEHAYQAAKFDKSLTHRENIRSLDSPGKAKRYASSHVADILKNFDDCKVETMTLLQLQKFSLPDLRARLLATGDCEIIEGNNWGDTFWGVCNGRGENHLGKIIMAVREKIRSEV